ncbi:dipeptide/oligopeptide/nickel ABC transporter ATP-binding protein [Arthrobacter sp. MYb211]|uniref:ABC transporter ATP-binding protein n=1 Tax=unclassified Arthrobacter TaxID=235627 RepID=UPI000CFB5F32|nr:MULTISPECIES: oligopeptide/dipeptide ABC transporter ATP-binding protein [unclassified Arthrobacter]PRA10642.1 dipeptide/oligopeptide/nickel ABC transporter ATP-binding protein [Arthrobacter sp. MYb221]PRC06335.1 dipeptide/oligopeptide/nickel ABC transporter ATP-binding protein [Arthrobacter sp. MYb211]
MSTSPSMSPENVLEVKDLSKTFHVSAGAAGSKELRALDGINLHVRQGETLGLVGESGCGKSTLARTLMMLETPDTGTVRFEGQDPFALRGKELLTWRRRVQMVFQDPFASLNARMTAGQIITEPFATHKDLYRGTAAKNRRLNELLDLVGLRATDAAKSPQEFSGGQRQRIGIARALALDPDLIILDEPVSALDLSVQAQVLNLLNDLQQELGVSYIFISHDLSVVRHVTDRVAVMYLGRIIESGSTEQVFDAPLHPYTASLMSASPKLDPAKRPARRIVLQGELPSPLDPPSGCRFRTRCWKAQPICSAERPEKMTRNDSGQVSLGMPGVGPGAGAHVAECHFPVADPSEAGLIPAG